MSNMHVLDVDPSTGIARVVMHLTTPVGNNAAGVGWAAALVGAKLNTTVLTTGTGAGQIATAEASAVLAGTTFEYVTTILPDPFGNSAARLAQLDAFYTATQARILAEIQKRLNYFGLVR